MQYCGNISPDIFSRTCDWVKLNSTALLIIIPFNTAVSSLEQLGKMSCCRRISVLTSDLDFSSLLSFIQGPLFAFVASFWCRALVTAAFASAIADDGNEDDSAPLDQGAVHVAEPANNTAEPYRHVYIIFHRSKFLLENFLTDLIFAT